MPFERRSALLCRAFGWRSAFQRCDPLASSLGLSALEDRLRKGDGFRPAVNSEINCIYITPSNRPHIDPRRSPLLPSYVCLPARARSCEPTSSGDHHACHQIPRRRFHRVRLPAHRRRAPGPRHHPQVHRRQSHSHHRGMQPRRPLSARTGQAHGRPRLLRREPQGLWLRRDVATSNTAW